MVLWVVFGGSSKSDPQRHVYKSILWPTKGFEGDHGCSSPLEEEEQKSLEIVYVAYIGAKRKTR